MIRKFESPPHGTAQPGFTGDAELGQRIRDRRKQLEMTQEELAHRIDVTQGAIGFWETGRTQVSIAHLKSVARELGLDIESLLNPAVGADLPNAKINERRLAEVLQVVAGSDSSAFMNLTPKKQAKLLAYLYSAETLPSASDLRSLIALAADA